jgi:UDP-glucose 4-epimerase
LRFLPARNEVLHAYSDHSKTALVFGDQPSTALEEGLSRMWAWAQLQGPRKSKKFDNIEIDRNLPLIWREE